ncbi:methyltransferase domain-containing protein [Candidatus Marithrix sp. Canyon 246]|uniref:methyltransferase domain-containing protein n=1 Tax=Candidatus Marithrix sp. Canyon 246 TaxID=1827136 RepID=UPI00084A26BB|nr:methyltransferase domain-containing protein [Candidatus Marithrix sp. Canyon 246]
MKKNLAQRIHNYDNPRSIGSRFRAKRIAPLREMINKAYQQHGKVSIIDVGGTKTYWNLIGDKILSEKNVTITVINLAGTLYEGGGENNDKSFTYIEADGCDLSQFEDKSFHIVHSNSVIEHVGSWERMVTFAEEIRRVGQNYFVQAPYFWFPIEPHFMVPFIHWFSEQIRVSLVMKYSMGEYKKTENLDEAVNLVKHIHLPDKKMFSRLFSDAEIKQEKVFLFTKSLIAIKDRL